MADNRDAQGWMREWQAMQKQFADAWSSAASGAASGAGAPGAGAFGAGAFGPGARMPISEGFEQWVRLFGGAQPGAPSAGAGTFNGGETMDRMLAGARQYVAMMQSAVEQMSGKGALDANAFTNAARGALGGFGLDANPVLAAMRQATGDGAKSFESIFAAFVEQAEPMKRQLMSSLNLPAFGYSREQQEHHQQSAQAWSAMSDELKRYNKLMLKASEGGLSRFESKLGERSEPGREIKSLREFYDVWIDAAEEGFAEVALSPEYREVYGALVNAQMRVRKLTQEDVERSTSALGMPTRTELDSTHRKLAEMRRRLARIEEHLSLDEIAAGEPANDEFADAPAPRAAKRPAAARSRIVARSGGGPGRESGGPGNEQGQNAGGGPGRESGGPGNEQGQNRAPGGIRKKDDDDDIVRRRPPLKKVPKKIAKKQPGPPGPGPVSFADRLAAQKPVKNAAKKAAPKKKGR
jgi:polyhydroxyalkanoate synthase subunit PhaE